MDILVIGEQLLHIIQSNAWCTVSSAHSLCGYGDIWECPLNDFCYLMDHAKMDYKEIEFAIYNIALFYYIDNFGKDDLVAELI